MHAAHWKQTAHWKQAARGATAVALAIGLALGAAMPAGAEIIDTADGLLQKARPLAFGDGLFRKQLCARSGIDGTCRDGLPSVKDDLLHPQQGSQDPLPPIPPIDDMPPVADMLPPPAAFDETPPRMLPAAAAPVSVPEPSMFGVLLLAAAGLAVRRPRRATRC